MSRYRNIRVVHLDSEQEDKQLSYETALRVDLADGEDLEKTAQRDAKVQELLPTAGGG